MSGSRLKSIFINKNRGIILGFITLIIFCNTGIAAAACSLTQNTATATTTSTPAPASPSFACKSGGVLSWILCPVISLMEGAAGWLDDQINDQLQVNSCYYFNPVEAQNPNCDNSAADANSCATSQGFYIAWSSIRSLALGFLVVAALIMVTAQALGFGAMDAYTVKKVLPRILIAVIGISLSYQLIQFAIQVANDLGVAIQSLIYGSFSGLGGQIKLSQTGEGSLILGGAAAFLVAGGGLLGVLTFIGAALVATFMAFFVIILRQILIIFLAILAPIAIAMYILPGTEKMWKMWWNTFSKALLMFPLIAGIIAVGHVFAEIAAGTDTAGVGGTIKTVIALIAYFGPYFIIPQTFKFAGGVLATTGTALSKASKGVNKSLGGVRANRQKTIHENRMGGNTKFGSGTTGNLYRRIATGSVKKSKFEAVNQRLLDESANKRIERDAGRSSGDDIATGLALQDNMNKDRFVDGYSKQFAQNEFEAKRRLSNAVTDQDRVRANVAMQSIQTNFGTRIGTEGMQVAAFKARTASVNAYLPGDLGDDQLYKDAGRMVSSGLMSETAVTQAIRSNKARPDHAASYGSVTSAVQDSANAGGASLGTQRLGELRYDALQGAQPAEIVAAHQNTLKAFAPTMISSLQQTINSGNDVARDRELAKLAGLYDTMAQTAPKKAEIFAKEVMSKSIIINGQETTVQKAIDAARGNESFAQMRRDMMMGPPQKPETPPPAPPPEPPSSPSDN